MTVDNKFNQTTVSQIERIHKPTPEDFKSTVLSYKHPVIFTGIVPEWKAFTLWSLDYLNTVLGNKEITVRVSDNQIFTYDAEVGVYPTKKMKFTDFTDLIVNKKKDNQYYYIQQYPIDTTFPELLPDITIPDIIDKNLSINTARWMGIPEIEIPDFIDKYLSLITIFWMSNNGNITQLHHDPVESVLCQVRGRKRILLFEPKQSSFLYPFPKNSKVPFMSQLNIDKPDIDKFPQFRNAKYIECILEAGEILFFPSFWWHQVYSLDELNISVSFVWNTKFKKFFRRKIFQENK
ncbi:JmjC domain-containing protein [Calothrix sp. NIES-2100]|uniref:cupin-like domain-containing protein n=1 Tax=Calothrix sp. NIES-2100 TaxID=1954172 RepID=UPI000B5E19A6|nr:JmjC domain-containing protein [Calothrix sp. NIES-2100]